MAKPDAAHPAGRHEHATLAQFVTDTDLAKGRVFDGVGDNRFFCFNVDPFLRVGNPASPLQQRFDTAFVDRVAIAVKRIAWLIVWHTKPTFRQARLVALMIQQDQW